MTQLELNLLPQVLAGTSIALKVLQARLLVIISMILTFSLFCAAMALQTQAAIIVAVSFSILVFLPILIHSGDRRHAPQPQHTQDTQRSSAAPTSLAA
jgi:hypothetical protein